MTTTSTTETKPDTGAIRVAVAGPDGRMGRVMVAGLPDQEGIIVVGGLRRSDHGDAKRVLGQADVLVEFTTLASSPGLLLGAIEAGVRPVSGTSGLSDAVLDEVDQAARARGIGAVWAPHFRLAGVLMMHLAELAARYLDCAEITEAHHAGKADVPSGTALELAKMIRAAHGSDLYDAPVERTVVAGARGGQHGGVRIHSMRMPGIDGWHEVTFGGDRELLVIRHDDFGREAYVPTVARAVREVMRPDLVGLLRGYGAVIGLGVPDDTRSKTGQA